MWNLTVVQTENLAERRPGKVKRLQRWGLDQYRRMVPPAMGLHTWVLPPPLFPAVPASQATIKLE